MSDANKVRESIIKKIREAGIVEAGEKSLIYAEDGREYLLLFSVVDISNWQKGESDD